MLASNNSMIGPVLALGGTAVMTAIWLAALVTVPGGQQSEVSVIVALLAVHIATLAGAWLGLSRTSLTVSQRRTTWLAISIPLTLWHGAAWAIVANGLLLPGAIPIPLLALMIVVPTAVVVFLVTRSKRIGVLLDAMPVNWLVGFQVYRVIGGVFLINWWLGNAPGIFAVPAGTGDVITGLLALPTAIMLANGRPGSGRSALVWNFIGISDLVLAVTLGALTSPGPLQHLAFDHPNLLTGSHPTAIIPAFTVPTSLVLHALSLRQLRRRSRRTTAQAEGRVRLFQGS